MFIRLLTASALAVFVASPAFADCQQEVSKLDEAVVTAETGADAPATPHQEQVLGGGQTESATEGAGTATGSVEAVSPHQREAVRELPDEDRTKVTTLLSEARDMATGGNEQGCMDKVAEAKTLLGISN